MHQSDRNCTQDAVAGTWLDSSRQPSVDPSLAGLLALVNQGRAVAGESGFNSSAQLTANPVPAGLISGRAAWSAAQSMTEFRPRGAFTPAAVSLGISSHQEPSRSRTRRDAGLTWITGSVLDDLAADPVLWREERSPATPGTGSEPWLTYSSPTTLAQQPDPFCEPSAETGSRLASLPLAAAIWHFRSNTFQAGIQRLWRLGPRR